MITAGGGRQFERSAEAGAWATASLSCTGLPAARRARRIRILMSAMPVEVAVRRVGARLAGAP